MSAGYSGTPLLRKLGVKEGFRMRVVDPPRGYWKLLGRLPDGVEVARGGAARPLDFIHLFVKDAASLPTRLKQLRTRIAPTGMIWVSWPKRASKVPTDVTEDVVREAALRAKLVDVKVCAVDETWSGLKLVIRLKHRPRA